jgi:hypothetical protein
MEMQKQIGFHNSTMLMPLDSELDVPLPPGLAAALGYTWNPAERYVCFFWTSIENRRLPELVWFDGTMRGFADQRAWSAFVKHPLVAPTIAWFELGGRDRGQGQVSRECLLLDTVKHRLYAVPLSAGCELAECLGQHTLRSLPVPRLADYLNAAQIIQHRAKVDREKMLSRRDQEISKLKDWLDINGLPF